MQKAVVNRVGQCVLTCPTTACYNGLPLVKDKTIRVGGNLRFFGDGFQFSKKLEGRRFWRLPVMDGEFICEDVFGTIKGVAGGNFLILGESQATALAAAEAAVAAIRQVPGVILPFPGGIVRSGSKVGSRYKKLRASTNDAYCPTLRGLVQSALPDGANAVYEIVIDGVDLPAVEEATRVGVPGGVPAGRAAHHGGQLRRQTGAVSPAPAQVVGGLRLWRKPLSPVLGGEGLGLKFYRIRPAKVAGGMRCPACNFWFEGFS